MVRVSGWGLSLVLLLERDDTALYMQQVATQLLFSSNRREIYGRQGNQKKHFAVLFILEKALFGLAGFFSWKLNLLNYNAVLFE
jgi:hypothetical protein